MLLKNDKDILPLDATKIKTIAVIGQNAQAKFAHDGNSAADQDQLRNHAAGGYHQAGRRRHQGELRPRVCRAGRGGERPTRRRGGRARRAADLITPAVDAAKNADVAIVCAGLYRDQDQEAPIAGI